jgi:HEXXH motif-containing protein
VRGAVTAPVTRDGIVLDFDSPSARRTPRSSEHRADKLEAPVPMPAADRRVAIDKIERALAGLAAGCPPAHQLVTTMTRVIMPRQDSVHPELYTSASIRTTIGRTTLNNPHRPGVTVAQLASSLVHEAIHAYLYIEERTQPLVTDWDRAFDTTAASPWTGTLLSVPTYLHACFVWHGLRALWRLPAVIDAFGEPAARIERAKAEHGFAGPVTTALDVSHALVAPRIWTALERMIDVR